VTAAGEVPTAVYFDTAYVAKCYVNESDSPGVRALLARGGGAISSALCMPEMAAVLARHEREGALDHRQVRRLFADFEKDVARGVWTLAPVTDDLLRRVARRIQTLPATVFLRAADAIHLCTAAEAGLDEVWTSDRHMLAAAPVFGLRACSV
jgi:predicted nucleic acid-binding protein